MNKPLFSGGAALSRRRFVTGAVAGALVSGLCAPRPVFAAATARPQWLRGNRFDLNLDYREVNFTGRNAVATVVNGGMPGPVLRWREGDDVVLHVHNKLAETSSIHWHGIILPADMDGVPDISFAGIPSGSSYRYHFPVMQSGTYWYHSHSGFQEQTGMIGALIIDPAEPEPFSYERDYVMLLSDWTDEDPHRVFAKLKRDAEYYQTNRRTVADLVDDIGDKGLAGTWRDRAMWNRMRMSDRDIADVTGATYTFLLNGQTPDANWTGVFSPGERVRLRIINAAAMTFFDLRIPGLQMTVVAADGQNVQPVTVDEVRLGVAETIDVIVTPQAGAYTVFAQAMDRSGYARGTLTERPGLTAVVPELDAPPVLSHADMGMAMAHGDHSGHQLSADHSAHTEQVGHGGSKASASVDHGSYTGHAESAARSDIAPAGMGSMRPVVHAPAEFGFGVDMRAEEPQVRLDDPGPGLRDNGRRVFNYADLQSLYPTADPREPSREIQLHLTGNMHRYMWSFDGVPFASAEPLLMRLNERLRITLVNDTMMSHPIHLHGMWSDLETGYPANIPRKHTVVVQPGAMLSYLVTPEVPGAWAYHCHLLYHMMGMFRRVEVA